MEEASWRGRHLGGVWEASRRSSGGHLGVIWEASGRPGLPRRPQGDLRGRSLKNRYTSQLKCKFSSETINFTRRFEGDINVDRENTAT